MNNLNLQDVLDYVEGNISTFHDKRLERLKTLKLNTVLGKKNIYMFRAKHMLSAGDIVKNILDAFISSQEETIFGDWLEGLAIFINERVYGGRKSGIPNIDLEFDKEGVRYIVTIKSGPNWGNSNAVKKMRMDFVTAQKTIRTSGSKINVFPINGCCYGRLEAFDRGDYYKLCGQRFWEFISGDPDLYLKIIEPLGYRAKERNEDFQEAYSNIVNLFTYQFSDAFCKEDGSIDWEKLVLFNSGKQAPKIRVKKLKSKASS